MTRNQLIDWLNTTERNLKDTIANPMTSVYNWIVVLYNFVLTLKQGTYDNWRTLWGYAPSFLAPVTNWLRDTIWTYAITPVWDRAIEAIHLPLGAMDTQWNYNTRNWYPAENVAYAVRHLGDVVLGAYDGLISAINSVGTSLTNYIGGLEQWATDWINYLNAQATFARDNINHFINVDLPNTYIALNQLNNIVFSWQPTLNQFFTDPGEFVWIYLQNSILEKIRVLLKAVW